MCSRYDLNATGRDLLARFSLRAPPPLPNNRTARPTDMVLAIGPQRRGRLVPWGFQVSWQKAPLINARIESVTARATFRPLLRRRVLLPATSFTEWRTDAGGGKHLNRIHAGTSPLFALAGLLDADARVVVLTCAAAPAIAHIHGRMPVIPPDTAAEHAWLDPGTPFDEAVHALGPHPGPFDAVEDGGDLPALLPL